MPIINENEYAYTSSDRTTALYVREWVPDCEIIGVIQIIHGVAEYIERYADFARFLASKGFVVVGNDLLGHGKSIPAEDLGFFGDHNGWQNVVDDTEKLRRLTAEKWPDLPYFLLGHSMGSFIARTYMIRYPSAPLKGVILSSTGQEARPVIILGEVMCKAEIATHGRRFRSEKIHRLAMGSYGKRFNPRRTDFDWLSRDEALVDTYVADPLCGFLSTVGLYADMMNGLAYNCMKKNLAKMNSDLPVYFMSGDKDPVGKNGAGVKKTYGMFIAAGMKDLMYKYYSDGRHEMLNETNKDEVYSDIYNWMLSKIG